MVRVLPLDDLMGMPEIADYLAVRRGTVYAWRQRGILPPPDVKLAACDLWLRPTIDEWAKQTGRVPS